MIHLDTHVAIWALLNRRRLTRTAQRLVNSDACVLSPAVMFEVEVLFELQRLSINADQLVAGLRQAFDVSIAETRFDAVVDCARRFAWTRDPFDRLIVANAIADGADLITADEAILRNFPRAVW